MSKINGELIIKGLGMTTSIVLGVKELKDAVFDLFELDKCDIGKKEEDKQIYEKELKERGRERKLYEVMKETHKYPDNKRNNKYKNLDLLLVPIPSLYISYKLTTKGYEFVNYELTMRHKYKEFKRIFDECGLKEKMVNDINYMPDSEEIENIEKLFKLETGVELIDVLQVVFKK